MDFKLPNNVEQLRVKTRKFVDDNIIPLESEHVYFKQNRKRRSKS